MSCGDHDDRAAVLPGPLIDTAWLADHLGDPRLRVFDCTVLLKPDPPRIYRIESGRPGYEAAHIPGAGFLDLIEELSDPASDLAFTLPPPERFAAAMSRHGVGPGSRVVLYSATLPPWATRVWWMLRAFGFEEAAVLDGGLAKWRAEGRPVTQAPCVYPGAEFVAAPQPGWFVGRDEVRAAIGAPGAVIVNALSPEAHRGETPVDYGRPGRIAGSRNVYYQTLLDAGNGTFKPVPRLRAAFAASGAAEAAEVTVYCGGGISATTDAFALHLLGHRNVRVYDGSLSEWARDPALPMESG